MTKNIPPYIKEKIKILAPQAFGDHQKAKELADFLAKHRLHKQACSWYTRAAEKGNIEALYELALIYRDGIGVEVDKQFYFTCREEGIAGLAFTKLCTVHDRILCGDFYALEADNASQKKAFKQYCKALEVEPYHEQAYERLIFCYFNGFGTKRNLKTALKLSLSFAMHSQKPSPGITYQYQCRKKTSEEVRSESPIEDFAVVTQLSNLKI